MDWRMNSDPEGRVHPSSNAREPEPAASVLCLNAFESHFAAAPEPSHHFGTSSEPNLKFFQMRNQPHIEIAPKSFRSRTAIMPKDRQHTAESPRVFDKTFAKVPRLRFVQTHSF